MFDVVSLKVSGNQSFIIFNLKRVTQHMFYNIFRRTNFPGGCYTRN